MTKKLVVFSILLKKIRNWVKKEQNSILEV